MKLKVLQLKLKHKINLVNILTDINNPFFSLLLIRVD